MNDTVNMTDSGNYFPAFILLINPQNVIFPCISANLRSYLVVVIYSENASK